MSNPVCLIVTDAESVWILGVLCTSSQMCDGPGNPPLHPPLTSDTTLAFFVEDTHTHTHIKHTVSIALAISNTCSVTTHMYTVKVETHLHKHTQQVYMRVSKSLLQNSCCRGIVFALCCHVSSFYSYKYVCVCVFVCFVICIQKICVCKGLLWEWCL